MSSWSLRSPKGANTPNESCPYHGPMLPSSRLVSCEKAGRAAASTQPKIKIKIAFLMVDAGLEVIDGRSKIGKCLGWARPEAPFYNRIKSRAGFLNVRGESRRFSGSFKHGNDDAGMVGFPNRSRR